MKLDHQMPERLLSHSWEDHLADNPVWKLDHRLGDVGQNLHLARHTFEVSQPLPMELLLRARAQTLDQVNGHPRHIVRHL
jgi:hypothetical protein